MSLLRTKHPEPAQHSDARTSKGTLGVVPRGNAFFIQRAEVEANMRDAIRFRLDGLAEDGEDAPEPRVLCEYIEAQDVTAQPTRPDRAHFLGSQNVILESRRLRCQSDTLEILRGDGTSPPRWTRRRSAGRLEMRSAT